MSKKSPVPKYTCPTCDGLGKVEIPLHLFHTLQIVKKLGKATSFQVHKHEDFTDRVGVTAVTNRLDDLFKHRLVTRVYYGRGWIYSAK